MMTHRMMMLALQLGTILLAARLGNILFERLRLPGVMGELCAGILIGPYLLGGIHLPGLPQGLFPAFADFAVSPELYGVCTLASIVLLFMVGLETDIRLLVRFSVAGGLVGVGGVLASFLLGDAVAVLFSPLLFGRQLGFMDAPCLFLGIISTATSVGITARVLSDNHKLDSPEGTTVLAGAVIDDVLGIILLAIGMGIITASGNSGAIDWNHIGVIALKAVGTWLVATAIALIIARRVSAVLKRLHDRSSIAVMALGLALILGGLFEEAGLAMIVGAYVMGLSLSRTDINHVVRERLHPIATFLVPVFFTVMGMLVDVRLLASRRVLVVGLVYTVVVGAAKVVGGGIPALFCNFNWRGALRIGVGMLPRGEVTLIIAGVGLAAGILPPELFGIVVLMLLVTALFAPPLLVRAFAGSAVGLRRPVAGLQGESLTFNFPSGETADMVVARLLAIFDSEGFFVHTLNRRSRIYQLRKDGVIIGFQHRGNDVVFDCAAGDVPFVNTAMMEVVADLERISRELSKPVDRDAIARQMMAPSEDAVARKPVLAGYLTPDVLVPELKAGTKADVIEELLGVLRRCGKLGDIDAARRAVLAREETMSTGMQYGIAIPHGRSDGVARLVCAIGLKREGIDFGAIDGEPSRIFVLTLSPRTAQAPHMQFMSMVSQVLDADGRSALLACETADAMYRVLTRK